ncbi:MAG: DUF6599 family protein [Edaphobacter sp.]
MANINFKFRVVARYVLLLFLIGAAASVLGQTAKTILVEPPTPLLPAKFGPWQEMAPPSCSDCLTPDEPTGAVLKEDGLSRASQQTYRQSDKAGTIKVDAYQFGDATGAYSAFTFLRTPEMKSLPATKKIGTQAAATPKGDFLVWSGTTVVSASVSDVRPATIDELRRLVVTLPKVGGPRGLAPTLPILLPIEGVKTDTVKYALGPRGYQAMGGVLPSEMVGFDKSAEVVMAKYDGQGTLTLLMYPTPQIAGDRGRAIVAEMNRRGAAAGTVKLRRDGPLVLMTTGTWNPEAAQKIINGIRLPDVLTWNKPMPLEFKSELRKTASLLMSIGILSGILMLAAIVLGFFLGFGRAAIRVMQGKPAATEPEFLRIDLSGRSEKIRLEEPERQG